MNSYVTRDSISETQLEKWFAMGKNVLFIGDHGVGKTTIVKNSWDKLGLKSAIFSASTMDPWVDLIGIPKLVGRGQNARIEMARPQTIDEDLEAIFIDEYNRSPAAVRNAVLELIQFKSINGRKFPKLKVVWAAMNPKDTDNNYDVEEIDPAQEDRFHVIVKLSGKPNLEYFTKKYSDEIARGAIKWYENLPEELKSSISPRRLDYAVEYVVNEDGEARDIFPDSRVDVSLFTKSIRGNKKLKELISLKEKNDFVGLQNFFASQSNVQPCLKEIVKNYELANLFINFGDTEQIIGFANSENSFSVLVHQAANKNENLKTALSSYKKIHAKDPVWFEGANRVALAAKSALDNFSEYKDMFVDSKTEIKVGNLSTLISFKSPEEIIDEVNCMESASIYQMDEDSAKNILDFFSKIDMKSFNEKDTESKWTKKAYSLIYSAFNFFYVRDNSLIGASFCSKGCERICTAPPFGFKANSSQGGSRGKNGKVSVKGEDIN